MPFLILACTEREIRVGSVEKSCHHSSMQSEAPKCSMLYVSIFMDVFIFNGLAKNATSLGGGASVPLFCTYRRKSNEIRRLPSRGRRRAVGDFQK